jgi:hypothetical protein
MERLREKLAHALIRTILFLTKTVLTNDGGFEMTDRDWGVACEESGYDYQDEDDR